MSKKFSAYLYDLDGTLLDSFADLIHCIKKTLFPLEITNKEKIKAKVSSGGKAMMDMAIDGRLNLIQSEQKLAEFLALYYESNTQLSSLFDGVDELINYHQKNQHKWAIISNKKHKPTKNIAKYYHLKADIVLGRGFLKNPKPHPEPLLYVCEKLQVAPETCLFIGDHSNDILAAKAANMKSALASWGYIANLKELRALKPDYIIKHPTDLIYL